MPTTTKRASLLGLPQELRLQIYDYVFSDALACPPSKQFRSKYISLKGEQHYHCTCGHDHSKDYFEVPWLNLLVTCSTIATEIQAAMQEDTFVKAFDSRALIANLYVASNGTELDSFIWRQILCAPHEAEELVVHVVAFGPKIELFRGRWDTSLLASVYQTLNYLCHCGPLMNPKYPLIERMRLKKLYVRIHDDNDYSSTLEDDNSRARAHRDSFCKKPFDVLRWLAGERRIQEILTGFIDSIYINCNHYFDNIEVDTKQCRALNLRERLMPWMWKFEGYEWGTKKSK